MKMSPSLTTLSLHKPVDIIIPVYRGFEETVACIMTADASISRPMANLIVINDCSPEPALTDWLRNNSSRFQYQLLENTSNLGFVRTVNRGMLLNPTHDVLLLNSDVEVANQWLERLQNTAYSEPYIASVTPFANNATICSYPNFCEDNELPTHHTLQEIDFTFQSSVKPLSRVEIPTGVGCCMYLRRDCLDQIGLFDQDAFGMGYGEENDWCQRAKSKGWKNFHALDTFVYHKGGVSFAEESNPRIAANLKILEKRYPNYISDVQEFIHRDPASSTRLVVSFEIARTDKRPKVLLVSHGMGGGVKQHINELTTKFPEIRFLLLEPSDKKHTKLSLDASKPQKDDLIIDPVEFYEELKGLLLHVGVGHMHFHHVMGLSPKIWSLPNDLGIKYDVTVHDYYMSFGNPTMTDTSGKFCGDDPAQYHLMMERYPLPRGVNFAQWRRNIEPLLQGACRILCPSMDTLQRTRLTFRSLNKWVACWHPDATSFAAALPFVWQPDQKPLKVLVLGALSLEKGADILEKTALSTNKHIEFHLLGYAYRELDKAIITHGKYSSSRIDEHIREISPDVIWFPAQWPETYSYTLSAALRSGLPIAAPALGAFPERLSGRASTFLMQWPFTTADWSEWWLRLVDQPVLLSMSTAPQVDTQPIKKNFYQTEYVSTDWIRTPLATSTPENIQLLMSSSRSQKKRLSKKERMLTLLIVLRTNRVTRHIARLIPTDMQRKIKRKLSRAPLHDINPS